MDYSKMEPGDHLCCLYETEEEYRAVLTPFLRQGLEQGEKVVYIVDARTAEDILGYLQEAGLDVEPYLARGQLTILTRDDAYMREGVFDPEGMIALLRTETEQALAEGYPALRVTGEMTWALRGLPGSERLIEYETKLNEFLPGSQCLAICQYDRRRFDSEVLLDVLRTHPVAIVGKEVYDNFYYVPPDELLGGDLPAVELGHWLESLAERKRAEEALRESEARWRHLVQSIPAFVAEIDLDGMIIALNRAQPGFSVEDFLGKPVLDVVPPPARDTLKSALAEVIEKGTSVQYEYETPDYGPERTPAWYHDQLAPAMIDGELRSVIMVVTDITERKKAEEMLRESEERYRSLFDGVPVGLYRSTPQGQLLDVNLALVEMGGFPDRQSALAADVAARYVDPDERGRLLATIDQEGVVRDYEYQARRFDGTIILVKDTVRVIRDANGQALYYEGSLEDITERKRAEEEIAGLAKFPSENSNPVLRVAKDGTILYTNRASLPLLDVWECQEGQHLPDDWRKLTLDVLSSGASEDVEVEVEDRILSLTFVSVVDAGYVNVYGLDITERKRAEEELRLHSEIMKNMIEGVILTRASDGTIVYSNPTFEEMFGYGPGEIVGKHVSVVNAPTEKSPEETAEEIMGILDRTGVWRGEVNNVQSVA